MDTPAPTAAPVVIATGQTLPGPLPPTHTATGAAIGAGVYLLHFATPYHHARHYVGYSDNIPERLYEHGAGRGARLMEVIVAAGIDFVLARVWPRKGRKFERRIKRIKNTPRYCPICAGERALRRMKGTGE